MFNPYPLKEILNGLRHLFQFTEKHVRSSITKEKFLAFKEQHL